MTWEVELSCSFFSVASRKQTTKLDSRLEMEQVVGLWYLILNERLNARAWMSSMVAAWKKQRESLLSIMIEE